MLPVNSASHSASHGSPRGFAGAVYRIDLVIHLFVIVVALGIAYLFNLGSSGESDEDSSPRS